ncbi:MAG: hypothetical protein ACYC9M_09375 [Desulfobulbaceae bacterium]
MKSIRLLLPLFLALLCLSGAVTADAVAPGPEQKIFFSQFRTAVAGEDARKLIGLTHPQARQCTKEDDQEQYYGLIMKGLVQMLGRQQTITEISSRKVEPQDIQKSLDTAAQSGMKWPVTPEEQLTIRYDKEGSESSATLYIARDQDQWKWVHLCYQ